MRRDAEGFVVEVEGLPNLAHELVHALCYGALNDDHGFPYEEMPLDAARPEHRRLLWEELSCCALSCAFVGEEREARGEGKGEREGAIAAWFAEQLEILPVFWGLEEHPAAWRDLVQTCLESFPREFAAAQGDASDKLRALLSACELELGWPPEELAFPPFAELWVAFLASPVAPLAAG